MAGWEDCTRICIYSVESRVTVAERLGGVFVSAPADDLPAFSMENLRLFCWRRLRDGAACCHYYFATQPRVMPLRCLAPATASFAAGIFRFACWCQARRIENWPCFQQHASSMAVLWRAPGLFCGQRVT